MSCLIPFPTAAPVPDEPELWFGHDDIDRLFDDGTMLCPCLDCGEAIRREAARRPRRPLGLKTGGDRIVVTVEYLVDVMATDDTLEPLFYLPDDYVRDIYVFDGWWPFRRRARWWSLACEQDEEAEGRSPVARRVAKRQPKRLQAGPAPAVGVADDVPARPVTSLHEAVADVRRRHRALVTAAGRWALAGGISVPADHVALWAAAVEYAVRFGADLGDIDGVTGPCRRPAFHRFWWATVRNWCSEARCRRPADLAESFWHFYGFLADTGRLAADSDPVAELRKVLVCTGGLGLDGRPRPGRSPIPCECYRDYAGPRHGERPPAPGVAAPGVAAPGVAAPAPDPPAA